MPVDEVVAAMGALIYELIEFDCLAISSPTAMITPTLLPPAAPFIAMASTMPRRKYALAQLRRSAMLSCHAWLSPILRGCAAFSAHAIDAPAFFAQARLHDYFSFITTIPPDFQETFSCCVDAEAAFVIRYIYFKCFCDYIFAGLSRAPVCCVTSSLVYF